MKQLQPISAPHFANGYWADARNRQPTELAPPATNLFLTTAGSAYTRPGFEDTGWNLNNSGHAAEPLWVSEYNVSFFAFDNKVIYVDHQSSDAAYDTGVALTAASTISYYNGAVYVTNPTDGATRIGITRLAAAATTSNTSFTIETGSIYRFDTSGNFRIKGTNEAFSQPTSGSVSGAANNGSNLVRITTSASHGLVTGCQVVIASVTGTTEANGTWTVTVIDATHFDLQGSAFASAYVSGGTWTFSRTNLIVLTGTSSQAYAVGDLAVQSHALSSLPAFKKIVFWEEAMHGFGPNSFSGNQTAKRTLFYGDFADPATWTNTENFSSGKSGTQVIGNGGPITNAIELEDYLYVFTDVRSWSLAVADLNRSSGARPPHIFSRKYGTLNHRTATEMDGKVVFITQNQRIIRSLVAVTQGGTRLQPDELFDAPVRNLLANMDSDQTNALLFYWPQANYLLCQVSISGQVTTLVWDNNPITVVVDGEPLVIPGRWLPPVTNWGVKNFYTINGNLYGTDLMDHLVYQFAVGQTDDGGDISATFASGIYEIDKGRTMADWGDWEVSGGLARGSTATFTPYVTETQGTQKTFNDSKLDFGATQAVGQVQVGSDVVGGHGSGAQFARFDKSLKINPAKGRSFQAVLACEGDGQAMKVDSWRLPKVKAYPSSTLTTT